MCVCVWRGEGHGRRGWVGGEGLVALATGGWLKHHQWYQIDL